ncbi:MAG: signal recognition particle receptor subunit alpha, partial [Candidatus Kariarchaeaceae archaeon]
MVLSGLGKSLSSAMNRLIGRGKLDKELILELKNDIFRALLDADIQFDLAFQMAENLQRRALDEK